MPQLETVMRASPGSRQRLPPITRFGLRGGLGASVPGVAIIALWFASGGRSTGGAIEYTAQAFVLLLIGCLVGVGVSGQRALEQAITQQSGGQAGHHVDG